jgi:hypothetical protein
MARATITTWLVAAPSSRTKPADLARIVEQFRRAHGAGHDDGILRQLFLAAGSSKPVNSREQPVGEVVEIVAAARADRDPS